MIDFTVQVSDKPKGIAVGAVKECVHTLSRVFYALKTSREQRMMTLGTVETDVDLKRGGGIKERTIDTHSDPTV